MSQPAFSPLSAFAGAPEPFTAPLLAAQRTFFDHLHTLVDTAFSTAEKVTSLNLATSRSALREQLGGLQSWSNSRDLHQALGQQQQLLPRLEQSLAYSRSLYAIASETQAVWNQLLEAQQAEFNQTVTTLLDQLSRHAPSGSDVAVNAVKSALTAANSAFNNANKAARQVAEITEASVTAATHATVRAVGNGSPVGKKKAA